MCLRNNIISNTLITVINDQNEMNNYIKSLSYSNKSIIHLYNNEGYKRVIDLFTNIINCKINRKKYYICMNKYISHKQQNLILMLWYYCYSNWHLYDNNAFSNIPNLVFSLTIPQWLENKVDGGLIKVKNKLNEDKLIFTDYDDRDINSDQRIKNISKILSQNENKKTLVLISNKSEEYIIKDLLFTNYNIVDKNIIFKTCEKFKYDIQFDIIIDSMININIKGKNNNRQINYKWLNYHEIIDRTSQFYNCEKYYMMISREYYEILLQNRECDMTINPLHILYSYQKGLNIEKILSNYIPENIITKMKNRLIKYECINNNKITDIGIFASKILVELSLDKIIILYYVEKHGRNLALYIAVLCMIELFNDGIYKWPKRQDNEFYYVIKCDERMEEIKKIFGGNSDIDTILNVWIKLCNNNNNFDMNIVENFCKKNYLIFCRIRKIIYLVKECYRCFGINKFEYSQQDYDEFSYFFCFLLTEIIKKKNVHICKDFNSEIYLFDDYGNKYNIDRKSINYLEYYNNETKYFIMNKRTKYSLERETKIVNLIHYYSERHIDDTNSLISSEED